MDAASAERLIMLSTECGEVTKAVGKCLQHGLDNYDPNRVDYSNRSFLREKLTHFLAIYVMMIAEGDIPTASAESIQETLKKKLDYTYRQNNKEENGTI